MHAAERDFAEGSSHLAAGRLPQAIEAYRRSLAADPANPAILFNLALALRRNSEPSQAMAVLARAERLAPRHDKILPTLLDVAAEWANAGGGAPFAPPPAPAQARSVPISVVACSIEPAKEAALRAHYGAALAGREHEIVVIRDARSLAEGYTRGLAATRHPLVVFSHDDVAFASPDPFSHLAHALSRHDVVGLAGTTRLTGPALGWSGHPHLHGWLAYPAGGASFDATAYSLQAGVIGGMQALDGLLLAARREAAERVGFDAATFDGFHFYDLDFTYRAHRAGLAVAVTTDVIGVHASKGHFGAEWQRYGERFRTKFAELAGARGQHYIPAARVADGAALLRFYGALRGLPAG